MKINNNFKRHLVLNILVIFNNICLAVPFFILRLIYNVSFIHCLLVFLFIGLFYIFYWADYSKKIFYKHCNKNCSKCDMWHCDFYKNKIRSEKNLEGS